MSEENTLNIQELQTVVSGKFVTNFAVVDAQGNLIGTKAHKTREEAEVELGSLKYYAEGLAFARATAREGVTDKALVGKANIVAAYLMYQEQKSVKSSDVEVAEVSPVETAVQQEEF